MRILLATILSTAFSTAFSAATLASANLANSTFKSDSKVPVELQNKIVAEVLEKCPNVAPYSLQEVSSVERVERIDQGVIDYFYTTTLTGSHYFDGQHPITVYINVDSAIYSGYNPNGPETVRLITSSTGVCD